MIRGDDFRLGEARQALGEVEEALAAFAAATRADSTHVDAHFLRAGLLASSNRPEEAGQGYRRAIALDSQRADILWELGQVYMQQGQYLQAAEVLRNALELEPRNTHALYLLSLSLRPRLLRATANPPQCQSRVRRWARDSRLG